MNINIPSEQISLEYEELVMSEDQANYLESKPLTDGQARWLAEKLQSGDDYIQIGTQFIFSLDQEQWDYWLPRLPNI